MTLLVHDPVFLEHDTGKHPETAERLMVIDAELRTRGLLDRCGRLPVEPLPESAVLRVHSPEMLEFAKMTAYHGGGRLDPDTVVCPRSFDVALRAAGGCAKAVDRVLKGEAKTAPR